MNKKIKTDAHTHVSQWCKREMYHNCHSVEWPHTRTSLYREEMSEWYVVSYLFTFSIFVEIPEWKEWHASLSLTHSLTHSFTNSRGGSSISPIERGKYAKPEMDYSILFHSRLPLTLQELRIFSFMAAIILWWSSSEVEFVLVKLGIKFFTDSYTKGELHKKEPTILASLFQPYSGCVCVCVSRMNM